MPFYSLYARLFADSGVTPSRISLLFALWSATGLVAEIPTGALADRFSRRTTLVCSGILKSSGFATWLLFPEFEGFAAGFVLWGMAGALESGAFEALLYDGLAGVGAADQYSRVLGRVTAAELVAQAPAAGLAAGLFVADGYSLVGWVSVGFGAAASLAALALPDIRVDRDELSAGYWATMRAGVGVVTRSGVVAGSVVALALVAALDAVEEYFPLLAREWHVATAWTPAVVLGVALAGALGAASAGRARRLGRMQTAVVLVLSAAALLAWAPASSCAGIAALAVFYAGYRLVSVAVGARVQERLPAATRATATSVAAVGTELATLGVFAMWQCGGVLAIGVFALAVATALPLLLPHRA